MLSFKDTYYWNHCIDLKSCKEYIKKIPNGIYLKEAQEIVNNTFFKTFGGKKRDEIWVHSIAETKNGYMLAGYTLSYGIPMKGWLVKTDRYGNKISENTYHKNAKSEFNGIKSLKDGFLLFGWYKKGKKDDDGWLVKSDKNAVVLWEKSYRGEGLDGIQDCTVVNDGFVCAGNIQKGKVGFWFLKTDKSGSVVTQKYINPEKFPLNAFNSIKTSPDGFLAVGFSKKDGKSVAAVCKFARDGKLIWKNVFEGKGNSEFINILPFDGGCFATGYLYQDGIKHPLLVKIDKNGRKIWRKIFQTTGSLNGIVQDKKGLILTGWKKTSSKSNVWLLATDFEGKLLWKKHTEGKKMILPLVFLRTQKVIY